MSEESACQLRRRRSSGNPNLPLNLEVGYQVNDLVGGANQTTPSPGCYKTLPNSRPSTSALAEFRKKQQSMCLSFDVQVEECEEEEIIVDSDDEGPEENGGLNADRPITPMPIQDFGANVVYTEGPQTMDFLNVKTIEQDGYTDVSDADDDEEGN